MLQVACLLLDDPVPNRIHWPRQAELKINSMVYRPYGRNSNTKLGVNARDEPANAAHRCTAGTNKVQLTCVEDRPFCEYPSLQPHSICLVSGAVWWAFSPDCVCHRGELSHTPTVVLTLREEAY